MGYISNKEKIRGYIERVIQNLILKEGIKIKYYDFLDCIIKDLKVSKGMVEEILQDYINKELIEERFLLINEANFSKQSEETKEDLRFIEKDGNRSLQL